MLHIVQNSPSPRSCQPIPAVPAAADDSMLTQFNEAFEVLPGDTPERIRMAQQVRYQVYCVEHPHEKATHPDHIETDEFDARAVHSVLLHRPTQTATGTVRLILPRYDAMGRSFAVQRVIGERARRELHSYPLHTMAEISRFSISKQFRRRAADGTYPIESGNSAACDPAFDRRRNFPLMSLGMMQAIVRMSLEEGITDWCAAMEPTLLRLLAAMAIRFRPIGPLVEFHGLRQPCHGNVYEILDAMKRERPAFWSVVTDGGALIAENPLDEQPWMEAMAA